MTQMHHSVEMGTTVGLGQRLAAIFYDSLIIFACLMIVTAFSTAIGINFGSRSYPYYVAFMFLAIFLYFAWCWMHGGQTVGMKAWKFRLISIRQTNISWLTSISRSGSAILSWLFAGLGFLWVLIDPEKLAWHDRLSDTRLVLNEKD